MKRFKIFGAMALAAVIFVGCSAPAYVEKDETVDFSKYRTYTWIEKDDDKGNSIMERNVRQAVNSELSKAGWREVKNNPDAILGYDVLVERNMKEETNPVYSQPMQRSYYNPYTRRWNTIYYPSRFMGYERNEYAVREGTITVTVIDAKTDKTVWQGWTTGEVNSRNLTSKEIQNSVKNIFRKFDIAKN